VKRTLIKKKKSMKAAEELAIRGGGDMDFFLQLKEEVQTLLSRGKNVATGSHDLWMVSSDKNTGYFHNKASHKF